MGLGLELGFGQSILSALCLCGHVASAWGLARAWELIEAWGLRG